ncbi:MAG: ABC transporter permease [Saprospiraceae bacterium]|nr:ABC transporter permease [Saprospiraceae bacterium]
MMLSNYLKITLRNFRLNPGYTVLNVVGLTIGIAATLFILLYLTEETRFDAYHAKADRIYRISSDITEPDNHFRWAVTQNPLAMQLRQDFPEVEEYVRFVPNGRTRLEYKDKFFFEEKVFLVDSTVCDVFSFDFLQGDAKTALREPFSMALCSSVAERIFGNKNPIGEVLKTPSGKEYKVTGVYRDMPAYSHLIATVMLSANSNPDFMRPNSNSWGGFGIFSYVLLREGADPQAFAAKWPGVIQKYVAVIFDQFNIQVKYELLPLKTIHLNATFEGEPEPSGEAGFLYIFSAVALFMLLIACINYMNLATARATRRAMEVGVRKVLGSERRQLVWQFLSESLLFTLVSLALSFLLVLLLLPVFNKAFDVTLTRDLLWTPQVLLGALFAALLTGVMGGSYPAFYLSAFEPIKVLKGALGKGSGNPMLRKTLVIVQFAITIFMLIGTGIIYDQMNYLRTKNLGFDKENVIKFTLESPQAQEKYTVLREKLLQNPKITSIGTSSTTPGEGYGKNLINAENSEGRMEQYGVDLYGVDYDFFPTLGAKMATGRNFSFDYKTDSTKAVLVNEAMVKRLGWKDPIGRRFQFGTNDTLPFVQVVGVVKDFHQKSLYEPISSLLFYPSFNNPVVHARIQPKNAEDLTATVQFVENTWREVFPNTPFEYDFVDAAFMELYQADQIRAKIFTLFSVLMIVVACLGLLGLASFTAEQRTKEIGVRRVLGAATGDIVYLLTRNFVFLVLIAAVPAFLIAWFFMRKWLGTFAYHTEMNYSVYGLAFFGVALLTFLTTSYHALRAAIANPVKSLRSE